MPPLHLGEWGGSWSPCTHAMLRGRGSCLVLTAEPQSGGAGDGVRARMGGGGGCRSMGGGGSAWGAVAQGGCRVRDSGCRAR